MTLPDSARLWLFAFDGDVSQALINNVRAFCESWTSHGRRVAAEADVLGGRVLAVAAQISEADLNAGVSGCGIDAMQRAVETAAAAYGLSLLPALDVTFRDETGAWTTASRATVRTLARSHSFRRETRLLDLTPATLGALREAGGVERPAGETWHAAAFRMSAGV